MAPVTDTKKQTTSDAQAADATRRTETQSSDAAGALAQHDAGLLDLASLQQETLQALYGELPQSDDAPATPSDTVAAEDTGEQTIALLLPAVQQAGPAASEETPSHDDSVVAENTGEPAAALLVPATLTAKEKASDAAASEALENADAAAATAADELAPPSQAAEAPNVIIDDDNGNKLHGTGGVDYIYGNGGSDHIFGGNGNDFLWGGDGVDFLFGGDGVDIIHGGPGNDFMEGGSGADMLVGNDGNDYMIGGEGPDEFFGGVGIDTVDYGHSDKNWYVSLITKRAWSGGEKETLDGIDDVVMGKGDDTVAGTNGANKLWGGDGDDALFGLNGTNKLYGGTGGDELIGGKHDDLYDGGPGIDTVLFAEAASGVDAWLWLNGPQNTGHGTDTFVDVENLTGSKFDDWLAGDNGRNKLDGGSGSDQLDGGGGNDTLLGGKGSDILSGGLGNDIFDGGGGIDTASFKGAGSGVVVDLSSGGTPQNTGEGIDTFVDIENVWGSSLGDLIRGSGDDNQLLGYEGTDWIWGGAGDDFISGDHGDDFLVGEAGDDGLAGGPGADAYVYGDYFGNGGNDTIWDFENGKDKVFIPIGFGVSDFSDLTIGTNEYGQAVVNFANDAFGGSITFLNTGAAQIDANDFVFY